MIMKHVLVPKKPSLRASCLLCLAWPGSRSGVPCQPACLISCPSRQSGRVDSQITKVRALPGPTFPPAGTHWHPPSHNPCQPSHHVTEDPTEPWASWPLGPSAPWAAWAPGPRRLPAACHCHCTRSASNRACSGIFHDEACAFKFKALSNGNSKPLHTTFHVLRAPSPQRLTADVLKTDLAFTANMV